eukprot:TRINITY_DN14771_c0_g1_i2.p1 TRINITY_DN14771_c0_g1~~TRINITY_DN14771_c0_g1_i2.p1  ORF type:complete len:318 (-),score=51.46 TRINITY_DN14771_c0_g1_i2:27-980(-)
MRRRRLVVATVSLVLAAAVAACILKGGAKQTSSGGFRQARAVQFAKLAGAAYCAVPALKAWTCGPKCLPSVQPPVKVCVGDTTKAFVARWEGLGLVSFEGTKTYSSMVQDLRTYTSLASWELCSNCRVHTGFLEEWRSLADCIKDSLANVGSGSGSAIRVTGHSLGAATSALAMVSLAKQGWHIEEAYNFGMPRVGNADFARAFGEMFPSVSYRVTHHMDPVVHVPPETFAFQHVNTEVFYKGNLSTGFTICTEAETSTCAGQYSDIAYDLLYLDDHMDYMDEQTGSSGCVPPTRSAQVSQAFDRRQVGSATLEMVV